jgi:hypothetical protein
MFGENAINQFQDGSEKGLGAAFIGFTAGAV